MIILDTMLYYECVGLEKARGNVLELIESLNKQEEKAVSSVTMAEVISRHRHNPARVQKAIAPIIKGEFELLVNDMLPIKREYLKILNGQPTELVYEILTLTIVEEKKRIEAQFLSFVFSAVTLSVYGILAEKYYPADALRRQKIQQVSLAAIAGNLCMIQEIMKKALEEGFRDGCVSQTVKKAFCDCFTVKILLWNILRHSNEKLDLMHMPESTISAAVKCFEEDRLLNELFKLKNPFDVLTKEKEWPQREIVIKELSQMICDKYHRNPMLHECIMRMYEKIMVRGGKIEKNDIPDMLITDELKHPQSRLLTRDGDIKKILQDRHPESYELNRLLTD